MKRKGFPMLRVRDLRIDPASLGAKKLLVDVVPAYEYRNNQRTDTVTGYRYIVALPAHGLEKIGVRIDGKQLIEKPEGFAEVEPGVTVSYDPTGSGAGITGATDKTLDIGLSSRALKDDEKADVDGTTIALDGIAIIVNNASKVEDLTVDQLKQMFTGEITNWSEVGGDDGEIVLIGREAGSGTRDGFESIVDVKDSCKYAQELTATGAVISAVEANPLAIGYASLSAVGDTVKMVTVGGVECSEETVKDGSYEVQRPFVFVTNKSVTLSEQAQAFFDFATSADAADLIRTAGAVPVNE